MDSDESPQRTPEGTVGTAVGAFPELDETEVGTLQEYAQGVTGTQNLSVRGLFEAPDEVLTKVALRVGYLEVHKRTSCASGCTSCPHGPYVYHVRREHRPTGETTLHWVLIGPEVETDSKS